MKILRERVLVLNKDFMAIGTCTVRRAITLISNLDEEGLPKARAIAEDLNVYEWEDWTALDPGDFYIRSVSKNIKAPRIIVCRTKTLPRVSLSFSRIGVFKRDQYRCQYCDKTVGGKTSTIDHVLPRSRGGKHDWFNCVCCCVKCNNYKGDRTPEEAQMKLKQKPVKPSFVVVERPVPKLWNNFI